MRLYQQDLCRRYPALLSPAEAGRLRGRHAAPRGKAGERVRNPETLHGGGAAAGSRERSRTFYELPELFPRPKDYSRGIGVADLARAVETGGESRTRGFLPHIVEAITGLMRAAETREIYVMQTTCERPEPLTPGAKLGEL